MTCYDKATLDYWEKEERRIRQLFCSGNGSQTQTSHCKGNENHARSGSLNVLLVLPGFVTTLEGNLHWSDNKGRKVHGGEIKMIVTISYVCLRNQTETTQDYRNVAM
jgi:hypothetical protein